MKKFKLPILTGLIVALSFLVYKISQDEKESLFNQEESNFAIADTSKIDMFFIADKKGNKNKFEKKNGGRWLVNNDYYASDFMVGMLLGTISKLAEKMLQTKDSSLRTE